MLSLLVTEVPIFMQFPLGAFVIDAFNRIISSGDELETAELHEEHELQVYVVALAVPARIRIANIPVSKASFFITRNWFNGYINNGNTIL
jgi:hypothetical protein